MLNSVPSVSGSPGKGSWSCVTQVRSTFFGMDEERLEASGISLELKMCENTIRLSLSLRSELPK